MAVDGISGNQPSAATYGSKSKIGTTNLTMDDFFELMIAQLTNQDIYNTTDNTEFIAQMAQFSMVQALADLSTMSQTAYSVNLVGKEATAAYNDDNGELVSVTGIVQSVNLYNGEAEVVINGTPYALSSIMKVGMPAAGTETTVEDFLQQIQNSVSDTISNMSTSTEE